MKIIWSSINGATFRKIPMETVLRPLSFPHFADRPNELKTERAQRWRRTYKELTQSQHDWVLASIYWAFADCSGHGDLQARMRVLADRSVADRQLNLFQTLTVGEPLEITVYYRLLGSSKTHSVTVRTHSPSQQEQQC